MRGVLTGIIIGVLYVLGVNVFSFTLNPPLASEASGFVLSALGAFVGPKIFGVLTQRSP